MQQAFSKHTFKLRTPRSVDFQYYRTSCFDTYNWFKHYKLDSLLTCERDVNVNLVSEFYNNLHTSYGVNYRTRVAKRSLDFSYEILRSYLDWLPSNNDFVFYPNLTDELPPPFEHIRITSMHQFLFGHPRPDGPNAQITKFSSLELSAKNAALFKQAPHPTAVLVLASTTFEIKQAPHPTAVLVLASTTFEIKLDTALEKKVEPELSYGILTNPARVVPAQEKHVRFLEGTRYVPIKLAPSGFVLLKDLQPSKVEVLALSDTPTTAPPNAARTGVTSTRQQVSGSSAWL
ncbi:hypothetical protein ZIOFF_015614 [Zingiber officinale]|uniref:26S proteasome regulatory subunit RPN2 C-terminal domain-containing protein n=1 Tax=Zingiber officinale TaxID=94328 RepID=A0A8J5HUR8_ZINOF|nr:hypothetical protein ZIOFF_015614 [Zingiber officinale]